MEPFFPLHAYVCERCFLVQLEAFETPENIFSEYAYFSSYSESWLEHSRRYAESATRRLALGRGALVCEAASNDGYLLQFFREAGIDVLGIEPARNVASVALEKGIRTESIFLGRESGSTLRERYGESNLVIANNVIAHVPDVHDFVGGLKEMLAPGGVLTIEFPHLVELIEQVQFDTIYHEHFSYYSLYAMERVLERNALRVWDVETIPTHGGSLRVWAVRFEDPRVEEPRVAALRAREAAFGVTDLGRYRSFSADVARRKRELLRFLIEAVEEGKSVVGYGAPAKGNTLLNYCGVRADMLAYTVDRNPEKQGKLLPGSRIPVYAPEHYRETRPDYVLILPWNIRDEIIAQTSFIREWGGRHVIAIPEISVR